ncbi:MAG: HU family DNA-binding protein [Candidatus Nanopelagicales bacterium]|nr:HU family DNA-binding protein [Candidatus Nanopelagicales bacterium]MDZ4250875.1 HU family DNA-binding protein [Candidatus Nanopelagicales bacterium]
MGPHSPLGFAEADYRRSQGRDPVNRAELIDALAERLEKGRKEASETLDAVLDEIKKAVAAGEKVSLGGFGVFENLARTARDPQTGEAVKLKAQEILKFRPGADFKALVASAQKAVADRIAAAKKAPAKKA